MLMLASDAASSGTVAAKRSLWPACLVQSARKYAPSPESAETVAEAVMADCASYEREARTELLGLQLNAYQHLPGSIPDMVANAEIATDRRMDEIRRTLRGKVIGIVLEERAKVGSESQGQ